MPTPAGHSNFLSDALTLRTSAGRLLVFTCLSLLIFIAPYHWLDHLSFWQAIGWHGAPSIGLTRAYWLLLHAQPLAAWRRNHLIYLVLLVGLPLIGFDLYRLMRGRRLRHML